MTHSILKESDSTSPVKRSIFSRLQFKTHDFPPIDIVAEESKTYVILDHPHSNLHGCDESPTDEALTFAHSISNKYEF